MISLNRVTTSTEVPVYNYQPSIFMVCNTDSGPSDTIECTSLSVFEQYFNSYNNSESYNIAKFILNLGYKLTVKRAEFKENRTSLRVCNNGYITYPDYYTDDHNIQLGGLSSSTVGKNIYSFRINLELSSNLTSTDYVIISYLYSNGKVYNRYIVFDSSYNSNLKIDTVDFKIYKAYSDTDTTLSYKVTRLREILTRELGFKESLQDDGTYLYFSYNEFISIVASSVFNVKVNDNDNYLIQTYLTENYKVLDIYSKYDDMISDISVSFYKSGDNYILEVHKYDSDNIIILSEYHEIILSDSTAYNYIDTLVNYESELIEVSFNKDVFDAMSDKSLALFSNQKLSHVIDNDIDSENFYNAVLDTDLSDVQPPEIVIDSGIKDVLSGTTKVYWGAKYQNALNNLIDRYNLNSIRLYLYHGSINSYIRVAHYLGYIRINDIDYPGYIYQIILLANKSYEGSSTDINLLYMSSNYSLEYVSSSSTVIDSMNLISSSLPNVNELEYDGYYVTLVNPLVYFNSSSSLITLKALYTSVLYSNYIIYNFPVENQVSRIKSYLTHSSELIMKYTGSNFTLKINDVKLNNNKCSIDISSIFDYYIDKKYTLNISITKVITYQ